MTRNMFGFPKRLYEETRRNFRVKEALPIKWTIPGMESGSGRICDISSTGALIEADAARLIGDGTVIALDQESGASGAFLPPEGRVVWSKPKGLFRKRTLCGVEFTNTSSEVSDRLNKRIQERIGDLELTDKIINYITIALIVVMIVLGMLVLAQRASIYQTVERSSTLALNAISQQAKIYHALLVQHRALETIYGELQSEYAATRVLLVQTEGLLAEAKRQYVKAQEEIMTLRTALAEAKMETLGDNVRVLMAQRDGLRSDLKALEEEINTIALNNPQDWQARSGQYDTRINELDVRMKNLKYETLLAKIADQRKQVQSTKARIRDLRQQAAAIKREAQHKKDEIALSQGNRGFVVKNGKSLNAGSPAAADAQPAAAPSKKVNINVSFF